MLLIRQRLGKRTLASSASNAAAQRYASALFDLAQDSGALSDVHRDFAQFVKVATESEDLKHLMTSPAFSREDKTAVLTQIAEKSGAHGLLAKFVGTMAMNGRAGDVVAAQKAFDAIYAKQRGVKRAIVRTATEMSAEERQRIESILAQAVGGDVELTSEVDASLIGGIQLQVGSKLIDASLAAKLDRMNTAMKGA